MKLLPLLLASNLSIRAVDGFASPHRTVPAHRSPTRLLAANGPPQYDKVDGTLRHAERVSDDGSSVMLHIVTEAGVDYEPGHVLALEIQSDDAGDDDDDDPDSKAHRDARDNGGWMRGPYTVSRSTENSLDVLTKVVGTKSRRFASAASGTAVRFGGKFHVPILEGIATETTDRIVMISTGVGVGPCMGAIEQALEEEDQEGGSSSSFPPIDLIASYRTEAEVVCKDRLDELQKEYRDKFRWKTIITSEQGRLSSGDNLVELTDTTFDSSIGNTHYHLIGNGQMVSEFNEGLQKAGVPDNKITLEVYFNHKAEMNATAVDRIAAAVMETASASVA